MFLLFFLESNFEGDIILLMGYNHIGTLKLNGFVNTFVNYFIRGTIPRTCNYDSHFVVGELEYG